MGLGMSVLVIVLRAGRRWPCVLATLRLAVSRPRRARLAAAGRM